MAQVQKSINKKVLYNTIIKGLAGFDYIPIMYTETFTSGFENETMRCVNITILEDGALEVDENFTIFFSTDSIMSDTVITTIVILDNDSKCFRM